MYVAWALWGAGKLKRLGSDRTFFWRFMDATMVAGIVVLTSDLLWVLACGLRFGLYFPDSVQQLVFCALRDFMGVVFCLVQVPHLIEKDVFSLFNMKGLWILNVVFFIVWFGLAPDPSWTDWSYALRHDYGWTRAWSAFALSHIMGRVITTIIYWSVWNE